MTTTNKAPKLTATEVLALRVARHVEDAGNTARCHYVYGKVSPLKVARMMLANAKHASTFEGRSAYTYYTRNAKAWHAVVVGFNGTIVTSYPLGDTDANGNPTVATDAEAAAIMARRDAYEI